MKVVAKFFKDIREKYLNSTSHQKRRIESNKLVKIDEKVCSLVLSITENGNSKLIEKFIRNNRLSGYLIFLLESGKIKDLQYESLVEKAYRRFNKLLNTLTLLEEIGDNLDVRFYIIKSFNVIPYLPVYDIDIHITNRKTIVDNIDAFLKYYTMSTEREVNKLNFIPKSPELFKLSFHFDITWDGIKMYSIDFNEHFSEWVLLYPNVVFNTPKLESVIRLQECILERLHINFIDYLFFKNYLVLDSNWYFSHITDLKRLPYFIKYRHILKTHLYHPSLLLKNTSRYILWKAYYKVTGNVPFHE